MPYKVDFSVASSNQIEKALCERLEQIRLSRNITQAQLALESELSVETISRLERGMGVSLNTFIRVISALDIEQNLEAILPEPAQQPVEMIKKSPKKRIRARSQSVINPKSGWKWGDEKDGK